MTASPTVSLASPPSHRPSLQTSFVSSFVGGSVLGDFSDTRIRPASLKPSSSSSSHRTRGVVTMTIDCMLLELMELVAEAEGGGMKDATKNEGGREMAIEDLVPRGVGKEDNLGSWCGYVGILCELIKAD